MIGDGLKKVLRVSLMVSNRFSSKTNLGLVAGGLQMLLGRETEKTTFKLKYI